MRFGPSATAFFTSSRSNADSSPNTTRPLHSMARMPSTVLFVSFNCMTPLSFAAAISVNRFSRIRTNLVAQAYRVQPRLASPYWPFLAFSAAFVGDLCVRVLLFASSRAMPVVPGLSRFLRSCYDNFVTTICVGLSDIFRIENNLGESVQIGYFMQEMPIRI